MSLFFLLFFLSRVDSLQYWLYIVLDVLCCNATAMITLPLQANLSTLNVEPDNLCEEEDSTCFHGYTIAQLPTDVLPNITRLLSMPEVLVLGQVCRGLRSKLEVCGVITDIRSYLSLPKNRKRYVHRFVTGNWPLIAHLRNNPVGYNKSFPIQHSPAIYTKFVSYFREHLVKALSVNLVSSGFIVETHDLNACKLNNQHNCLIQNIMDDDSYEQQIHVWSNQQDGIWKWEYMIGCQTFCPESRQHHTDILIVAGKEDGKSLLCFVERDELGTWTVTQRDYLTAITPPMQIFNIFPVLLADNQRVMICEVLKTDTNRQVVIFCQNSGQWEIKGCLYFFYDNFFFKCSFSQDCEHIAIFYGKIFLFVSSQDDGTWKKSGKIESEYLFNKDHFEFSADDHHFVAWGEKKRRRSSNRSIKKDSQVIIARLDDLRQWSEVRRINRTGSKRGLQSHPCARFSPDGKQLFVCINDELIILSLQAGEWVLSTNLLEPWDGSICIISTTMDSSLFMVASDKSAWIYAIDASGVWSKQHEFSCCVEFLPKISPDGNTVICRQDESRHIDIWSRRQTGQWIKQQVVTPATRVEFSPEGSLAVLANGCDLTLLGLTEERQWQEKGGQRFDGKVVDFNFSPCSRSLRVDFQQGEGCVVSFWQIVPQV